MSNNPARPARNLADLQYLEAPSLADIEALARAAFARLPGEGGPPPSILTPVPAPWAIWTADAVTGTGHAVWTSPETLRGSFPDVAGGSNLNWAGNDRLTFLSETDNWPHLYTVAETGGPAKLLTPGAYMVEHLTVSRDGRSLVYSANTGETSDPTTTMSP